MSQFGELLKAERKRAGLTQQQLAANAGIDHSYISKMETGGATLPTRDIALRLAESLGISDKEARIKFLSVAGVVNDEDLEEFTRLKVGAGHAVGQRQQVSSALIYSTANPAIGIPDSLFGTIGDKIEEIKRLIDSMCLTDDEEEMVASQLDTTQRLVKFIAAQHQTPKER